MRDLGSHEFISQFLEQLNQDDNFQNLSENILIQVQSWQEDRIQYIRNLNLFTERLESESFRALTSSLPLQRSVTSPPDLTNNMSNVNTITSILNNFQINRNNINVNSIQRSSTDPVNK